MYKIKVRDDKTGAIWWEYGFTRYIMKRIHFLFTDVDDGGYNTYNILDIVALVLTAETFKKCLTRATKTVMTRYQED